MSNVKTQRAARRRNKELLTLVAEHAADEQAEAKHFEDLNTLLTDGVVIVETRAEAMALKQDTRDQIDLVLAHRKAIIKPTMAGFLVRLIVDDPAEAPKRWSEVERVVSEAEEWGVSVDDLLDRKPHIVERSSGQWPSDKR